MPNHCPQAKILNLMRWQLNNQTLIVSKGLGDTFPFRWNCPKEIVWIAIE